MRKHYDEEIWKGVEQKQQQGRDKIRQFFEDQADRIDELRDSIEDSDTLAD